MSHECECQSDQNCGCGGHHGGGEGGCGCGESHAGGECGCGGHAFERRYQTKAEQKAELEEYLNALKAEVQAVEEHLAAL